jgi:glutaminyl-peptide cyclotransferase
MPQNQQKRAAATVPAFDGERSYQYLLAQTDFGPRNPGSPGHAKCLDYLKQELEKYADAVNLQPFTQQGYLKETLRLTNIIASFNLQATTRVLLIAHWDTRPRADQDPDVKKRNQPILGANDAASGVAVLLEIARHLKTQPPGVGVDFVIVDGEDYGKEGDNTYYLLGSKYFVNHRPQGFAPAFGILLDMIGYTDLAIKREGSSVQYAPDIVELVWSTARTLGLRQFTAQMQSPIIDDHIPFNEARIKTIDLIDFDYPYWHTTQDTPDKCSSESLEAVGKVLLQVIYEYTP